MKPLQIRIKNEDEMAQLARKLASVCKSKDAIALVGELGSGKTFFTRHFINYFSTEEIPVLSPTFNLLISYPTKPAIFHFDLYRLKNKSELENIGLMECLENGICLIEWPEIALSFLPEPLLLKIEFDEEAEGESTNRLISISADEAWLLRLNQVI